MQIDCYGFEATSEHFQKRKLQPYRIIKDGNVTYICYENLTRRPIHRITKTDTETVFEWSYGYWNKRAELNYIPINETKEI